MKKKLLLIILFFSFLLGYSQEQKEVVIIEKKAKYKIALYATNTSDTPKKVLIQLKGQGFRNSGFKPITTQIKPQDTIYVTTVYKLKKVNNYLSYEVIHLDKLDEKEKKLAHQKLTH